jgi:hypothetical protein
LDGVGRLGRVRADDDEREVHHRRALHADRLGVSAARVNNAAGALVQ